MSYLSAAASDEDCDKISELREENKRLRDLILAIQSDLDSTAELSAKVSSALRSSVLELEAQALALPLTSQEPVAYEYAEHRPYGALGQIRHSAILLEHFRMKNGAIAGDWQWVLDQMKASKHTLMLRPLYAGPYIIKKDKV